jgi:hypothetical protein
MLTGMGGIMQWYVDASILITPRWDLKFHAHTDTSNLTINVMLVETQLENATNQLHACFDY